METLILPKDLHYRSLLAALASHCPSGNIQTIDFADVKWVFPSGLAALTCLIKGLAQNQFPVRPINAEVSSAFKYFQDMDFFKQFGWYQTENFIRRSENRAFARLVEIQQDSDSSTVARNLAKIVSLHGKEIHNDLFTCLEESVRNVVDWAGKPGFAVAQVQRTSGGERTYNIAICDYGHGIRDVLARNPNYNNVNEKRALELVVQKGVTTASSSGRDNFGIGLYEIDRIAETTRSGRFILGSGTWVRIREGNKIKFEPTHRWQGTSIEITLYLSGFRVVPSSTSQTRKLRFV